jgi:hypothetical protein
VECEFEKKPLTIVLPLDRRLRARGLFLEPAWIAPDYAITSAFQERQVTIGTPQLPLPATLTMPVGKGPFPVVILVHGSGPNDRDESIGPNKMFKDLAWGLGSAKIAVLRFTKRTSQYAGKLADSDIATVKEESIDDTISAVELLSHTDGIDPKRIIVLGHSLGGKIAPRIAQTDRRIHGIVVLAGPTRTEGRIHREQMEYLLGLRGMKPEDYAKEMQRVSKEAADLDSPTLKPEDRVEGIPGRYWLDLRATRGELIAQKLNIPIFVLQGDRDYQVVSTDYQGWVDALRGKSNATLRSLPGLNHHFMPGSGPSKPDEYAVPNHVPKSVIDELTQWVRRH